MDKKEAQKQLLQQETEKHVKRQEDKLVIDFDQALEEQDADTISVKFEGEIYDLPATPPAWLPIFISRHQKDGVLDDDANLAVIERLLGKELSQKILDGSNFVSFQLINDKILSPVFNHWGMSFQDETEQGKA